MNEANVQKITSGDPGTESKDILGENIARLGELFPDAVVEGRIDFDVLRQLLGDTIGDREEKYGLNWHGKQRARQIALTPSTGTLRPCPDESVDWSTTQNLMIEGDNLEVLKLLQKSYAGKVKLIYIDPPYNTGKDFVYPDDFRDNIRNYLELTGQIDGEGRRLSTNTEASGRFHTDWLNMMYPRLKLAHSLLRMDGLIVVSLDSTEASNLRLLLDSLFGEENFVGLLPTVMNLKGNNDAFAFSDTHEFTLVYARSVSDCLVNELPVPEDKLDDWDEDERGIFKRADTLRRTGQDASRRDRPNGWFPVFVTADGEVYATADDSPRSEDDVALWPVNGDGDELSWTWSKGKINSESYNLVVVDGRAGKNIYKKQRPGLGEIPSSKPKSILYKPEYSSSNGTAELRGLFGRKLLGNPPKPRALIRDIVLLGSAKDSLVLDFFAGSGTTGDVVMSQNAADGGQRRHILVQLPEPLDPDDRDQEEAAQFCDEIQRPRTVAELTKERLRRVGAKLRTDNPLFNGDTGFRVFKLDSSNIQAWDPERADLAGTLEGAVEHLKADRTEEDILYELLLKLGLDLCVPIESREIAGRDVRSVGGGALVVCLAPSIDGRDVEELANGIAGWVAELAPAGDATCVFRDSAFEDDVAKTNLTAILAQRGITRVRSL